MESVMDLLDFMDDPIYIDDEDDIVCRRCKTYLNKSITYDDYKEEVVFVWRCPRCGRSVEEV